MENKDLERFSLITDKETINISELTGENVYRILGFENMLLSTYDFYRNVTLPEGIWSVSKATPDNEIYQIHLNRSMLEANEDSVIWCANLLKLQIYLKTELDE